MADKMLRITFSGISTLSPAPPRNDDPPPAKAFVLMAANVDEQGKQGGQTNDWGTAIPDHTPFVHVAASALVNPPWPDATVIVCEGGEHFVYFFRDARVVIDPPKHGTKIEYFIDPEGRPLAARPGSDDVARADDIRWLADIRDVLPNPAPLKIDPAAASVGSEVAAIVNLDGGTLRANFPGDTVNPKTFATPQGKVISGLRRVLADEFTIDIPYPAETEQVTLSFDPLRSNTPVVGPPKLVLKWPKGQTTLQLRMGNDPKDEISLLDTEDRLEPVRRVGPVLKPRDDDFDLHYNLLHVQKGARPLPQNDIHQCHFEGCKPGTI